MEAKELAKMICDLAALGNMHPSTVLDNVSKLISGGDDKVRIGINRAVHEALYEMRQTIPWRIENPNQSGDSAESICQCPDYGMLNPSINGYCIRCNKRRRPFSHRYFDDGGK